MDRFESGQRLFAILFQIAKKASSHVHKSRSRKPIWVGVLAFQGVQNDDRGGRCDCVQDVL